MRKYFSGLFSGIILMIGVGYSGLLITSSATARQQNGTVESVFRSVLNNYSFGMGDYFSGEPFFSRLDDRFRLLRQERLDTFSPDDMETVCFAAAYQEESGYISSVQLNLTFTSQAHERFAAALGENLGKQLSFEFAPYKISGFVVNEQSLREFHEATAFAKIDPQSLYVDHASFSLSTSHENVSELMDLARHFSPDTVPAGCSKRFDPSVISSWDELINASWPSSQ